MSPGTVPVPGRGRKRGGGTMQETAGGVTVGREGRYSMETQTGGPSNRTSSGGVTSSSDDAQHGAQTNGATADSHAPVQCSASGQYVGRRVTPSTFKLDETP